MPHLNVRQGALLALAIVLSQSSLDAQTASPSTTSLGSLALPGTPSGPVAATLPLPVAATAAGNDSTDGHAIFTLGLNWNESTRHVSVAVPNSGSSSATVLGVQGTSGLYLTSVPSSIPAGGTANVNALLMIDSGGELSSDFLKILTSNGPILVELKHERVVAAQFSVSTLSWSVGGSAASQSATLTMSAKTAVPIGVTVTGNGNSATLKSNGGQNYTITVTPGSTAKSESFAAVVLFNPRLPGISGAIDCEVK